MLYLCFIFKGAAVILGGDLVNLGNMGYHAKHLGLFRFETLTIFVLKTYVMFFKRGITMPAEKTVCFFSRSCFLILLLHSR